MLQNKFLFIAAVPCTTSFFICSRRLCPFEEISPLKQSPNQASSSSRPRPSSNRFNLHFASSWTIFRRTFGIYPFISMCRFKLRGTPVGTVTQSATKHTKRAGGRIKRMDVRGVQSAIVGDPLVVCSVDAHKYAELSVVNRTPFISSAIPYWLEKIHERSRINHVFSRYVRAVNLTLLAPTRTASSNDCATILCQS